MFFSGLLMCQRLTSVGCLWMIPFNILVAWIIWFVMQESDRFTLSTMDINFWGSVYPTHFAIPHLMKTNGKIVVNASCAGVLNPPRGGFYNASKAALISFYESLRFEVSPTITITILTLGYIQTNFITAKYSSNGVGVRLRKDMRDVVPTMDAKPCVKAVIDGIRKGATFITEPKFNKALFLIQFLFYLKTLAMSIICCL